MPIGPIEKRKTPRVNFGGNFERLLPPEKTGAQFGQEFKQEYAQPEPEFEEEAEPEEPAGRPLDISATMKAMPGILEKAPAIVESIGKASSDAWKTSGPGAAFSLGKKVIEQHQAEEQKKASIARRATGGAITGDILEDNEANARTSAWRKKHSNMSDMMFAQARRQQDTGRYTVADHLDPATAPSWNLAFTASILANDPFFPTWPEKWNEYGLIPPEQEKNRYSTLFPSTPQSEDQWKIRAAQGEFRDIMEQHPDLKDRFVKTLRSRISERVKEIKLGAASWEEAQRNAEESERLKPMILAFNIQDEERKRADVSFRDFNFRSAQERVAEITPEQKERLGTLGGLSKSVNTWIEFRETKPSALGTPLTDTPLPQLELPLEEPEDATIPAHLYYGIVPYEEVEPPRRETLQDKILRLKKKQLPDISLKSLSSGELEDFKKRLDEASARGILQEMGEAVKGGIGEEQRIARAVVPPQNTGFGYDEATTGLALAQKHPRMLWGVVVVAAAYQDKPETARQLISDIYGQWDRIIDGEGEDKTKALNEYNDLLEGLFSQEIEMTAPEPIEGGAISFELGPMKPRTLNRKLLSNIFAHVRPISYTEFLDNGSQFFIETGGRILPVYPFADHDFAEIQKATGAESGVMATTRSFTDNERQIALDAMSKKFEHYVMAAGVKWNGDFYSALRKVVRPGARPGVREGMERHQIEQQVLSKFPFMAGNNNFTLQHMLAALGGDNWSVGSNFPMLVSGAMRKAAHHSRDLTLAPGFIPALFRASGDFALGAAKGLAHIGVGASGTTADLVEAAALGYTGLVPLPEDVEKALGERMKSNEGEIIQAGKTVGAFVGHTFDYFADYTDPSVLRNRLYYDLPFAITDGMLVASLSIGLAKGAFSGMARVAQEARVLHIRRMSLAEEGGGWVFDRTLVAEPDLLPGATRLPERAIDVDVIPSKTFVEGGFEDVPGGGGIRTTVRHEADVQAGRIDLETGLPVREVSEYMDPAYKRAPGEMVLDDGRIAQLDDAGQPIYDPIVEGTGIDQYIQAQKRATYTGPARTSIRYSDFIEFTNQAKTLLSAVQPDKIGGWLHLMAQHAARRGDGFGRFVSRFFPPAAHGGPRMRAIIENYKSHGVVTHIVAADDSFAGAGIMARDMLAGQFGSADNIWEALSTLNRKMQEMNNRADYAQHLVYEIPLHGTRRASIRRFQIVRNKEGKFDLLDKKYNEVLETFDTPNEAASSIEAGGIVDLRAPVSKGEVSILSFDEMLELGIPDNYRIKKIPGKREEGFAIYEQESGRIVFKTADEGELSIEMRNLQRRNELLEPEDRVSYLAREVMIPAEEDAYRIIEIDSGTVVKEVDSHKAAVDELREMGQDAPIVIHVTGDELAASMSSQGMALGIQELILNSGTGNRLRPDMVQVKIRTENGNVHMLDAQKLGLVRPRGITWELTPLARKIITDKRWGHARYEYRLPVTGDMGLLENLLWINRAMEENKGGLVVAHTYDVVAHKRESPIVYDPAADQIIYRPAGPTRETRYPEGVKSEYIVPTGKLTEEQINNIWSANVEQVIKYLTTENIHTIYDRVLYPQIEGIIAEAGGSHRLPMDRNLNLLAEYFSRQFGAPITVRRSLSARQIKQTGNIVEIRAPEKGMTIEYLRESFPTEKYDIGKEPGRPYWRVWDKGKGRVSVLNWKKMKGLGEDRYDLKALVLKGKDIKPIKVISGDKLTDAPPAKRGIVEPERLYAGKLGYKVDKYDPDALVGLFPIGEGAWTIELPAAKSIQAKAIVPSKAVREAVEAKEPGALLAEQQAAIAGIKDQAEAIRIAQEIAKKPEYVHEAHLDALSEVQTLRSENAKLAKKYAKSEKSYKRRDNNLRNQKLSDSSRDLLIKRNSSLWEEIQETRTQIAENRAKISKLESAEEPIAFASPKLPDKSKYAKQPELAMQAILMRQAIEMISEMIVRPESRTRRSFVKYAEKDGYTYPVVIPAQAQRGVTRDAFLTRLVDGQLKSGDLTHEAAKRIYDESKLLLNMPPKVPAHYTRDTMHKLITDAPAELLTFPEFIARYGADNADLYVQIVQNGLDKGFYFEALRAPVNAKGQYGIALASRDLVFQIIEDAGLEVPKRLEPLIMGADKTTGGPIEWRINFNHVLEARETSLNRKTHATLKDIAGDLGIETKKAVVLFESIKDQHGGVVSFDKTPLKSILRKIMMEEVLLEPVDVRHANINLSSDGVQQSWLARNNPYKSGMLVLKYKKTGKVVTVGEFNERIGRKRARAVSELVREGKIKEAQEAAKGVEVYEKPATGARAGETEWLTRPLDSGEIALLEDFRRTMEVMDVTETTTGKMWRDFGPEAMSKAVDRVKSKLLEQSVMNQHLELLATKSPIVAVKAAFDSLGFEALTAWDVWRRGSGEVPSIAEVRGYTDDWVSAGLVSEVRDSRGLVVKYEPTAVGVLASLYQIGRRQAFYQGIPFKAIIGEAQRNMAPQVTTRMNFKKFIDDLPGHAERAGVPTEGLTSVQKHQDRIKSVLYAINEQTRSRKWLSDPILAYQETVLSHAGDIGLYPTKQAALNAIEYYRNLWEGGMDHWGRVVSGNAAVTTSPVKRRGTRLNEQTLGQIEQAVGHFVMHMDPTMYTGFVVAELESRIGFVNLIEEFINEGLIRHSKRKSVIEGGEEVVYSPGKGFVALDLDLAFQSKGQKKVEARPSAEAIAKEAETGIPASVEFAEVPAIHGLKEKYGDLYATPQVAEMLQLRVKSLDRAKNLYHRVAEESNPIAYMFSSVRDSAGGKVKGVAQVIKRAKEIFGEDSPLVKQAERLAATKKLGARYVTADVAGEILAGLIDGVAAVSKQVNNNPIQQWYKRNALFRSYLGGAARNLFGNGMLAVAHHPEALLNPAYWEGMGLYFSDGFTAVKEGVGALGGAKIKTKKVRGVEVEVFEGSKWTPELVEFRNEMLSRQVFGQGLTAELRDEAALLQSNFYGQPYTKAFRDRMGKSVEISAKKHIQRRKKLSDVERISELDPSMTQLVDDITNDFLEGGLIREESLVESLASGAERNIKGALNEKFGGAGTKLFDSKYGVKNVGNALFKFPFNTKLGKAWESTVKSLFIASDDMYRWSYSYYLWKKKGLTYDQIAYEVGNFMPDFTRNSPVLHALRIANPWAFWPMKTMANFSMMAYKNPVRYGLLKHVSTYMDALDWQSSSPEETWAWFERPARERSTLLRTPAGDYSYGYAFFTGDNDAILDVTNMTDVGLLHLLTMSFDIAFKDEYKPRFGKGYTITEWEDDALISLAQRVAIAWHEIMKDLGPRAYMDLVRTVPNLYDQVEGYMKVLERENSNRGTSGGMFRNIKKLLRAILGSMKGGAATNKISDVAGKVHPRGHEDDMFLTQESFGMKRDPIARDILAKEVAGFDPATLDPGKVEKRKQARLAKAEKETRLLYAEHADKRRRGAAGALSEKEVIKIARKWMRDAKLPEATVGYEHGVIEAKPTVAASQASPRAAALIRAMKALERIAPRE